MMSYIKGYYSFFLEISDYIALNMFKSYVVSALIGLLIAISIHYFEGITKYRFKFIFKNFIELSKLMPLIYAVKNRKITLLKFLVICGFNVNIHDDKIQHPIHYAASDKKDNTKILKLLLKAGAYIDSLDINGQTPLFNTIKAGNTLNFKYLLSKGSNITIKTIYDEALMDYAIKYNRIIIFDILLSKMKAEKVIGKNANFYHGIFSAHRFNNILETRNVSISLIKRLIKLGYNPSLTDNDRNNALHILAKVGCNQKILNLLLEYFDKRSIEIINKEGETPLRIACINKNKNIIQTLLRKGVYIDIISSVLLKYNKTVQYQLSEGVNPNVNDCQGNTPLHYAVLNGHIGIINSLLQHGGKVNVLGKYKYTPLDLTILISNSVTKSKIRDLLITNNAKYSTELSVVKAIYGRVIWINYIKAKPLTFYYDFNFPINLLKGYGFQYEIEKVSPLTIEQEKLFKKAFNYISSIFNITFTPAPTFLHTNLIICQYDYEENCNTMADAGRLEGVSKTKAIIKLNPIYTGDESINLNTKRVYRTILHELGHVLGLSHPIDMKVHTLNDTIMSYAELNQIEENYPEEFTPNDLLALYLKYDYNPLYIRSKTT